ncbi:carbamate kinase [soil metagenome]
MRIVIALGGNALLRRGEALTAENQLANIKRAAIQIAKLATGNQLVITHGNGPQVGLLALQNSAYKTIESYPLDILDAQTEGMIGYLLEQEIANLLPQSRPIATLLTRVEVDENDPAFAYPSKPIGPLYSKEEAERMAKEKQWSVAPDDKGYRRVVASPQPQKIIGINSILLLLEHNVVVIAAGGGGIPVVRTKNEQKRVGIEAVIDKDFCSALLAKEIGADCLVIATDVEAVYLNWGKANQQPISEISPEELNTIHFPIGSMGPKVKAACQFVEATHKPAIIGALERTDDMLKGYVGTRITYNSPKIASPDGAL